MRGHTAALGTYKPRKLGTSRAPRRLIEQPIHIAIVSWLAWVLPPGAVIMHPANEGNRGGTKGRTDGAIAKAMGQRAGASDIFIFWAGRVLLIEVKGPDNDLTDDQQKFCEDMAAQGFNCAGVARSIDDARGLLMGWKVPIRDKGAGLANGRI